jgi:hypothetical protein
MPTVQEFKTTKVLGSQQSAASPAEVAVQVFFDVDACLNEFAGQNEVAFLDGIAVQGPVWANELMHTWLVLIFCEPGVTPASGSYTLTGTASYCVDDLEEAIDGIVTSGNHYYHILGQTTDPVDKYLFPWRNYAGEAGDDYFFYHVDVPRTTIRKKWKDSGIMTSKEHMLATPPQLHAFLALVSIFCSTGGTKYQKCSLATTWWVRIRNDSPELGELVQ